jgi:hypothetical protein
VTWIKVDDHMVDHPKIRGLGKLAPLAVTLQLRALCYASRYLTDGRIPAGAVDGLLDGFDAWGIETGGVPGLMTVGMNGDEIEWPAVMVDAGLWERLRDGDYLIHDYLDYNPARESVLKDRDANKRRQKDFRQRNTHRNGVTNGPVTGAPSPSPVTTETPSLSETTSPADEPPPVIHTNDAADLAPRLRTLGIPESEIGQGIKWWRALRGQVVDGTTCTDAVLEHLVKMARGKGAENLAAWYNPRNVEAGIRFRQALAAARKAEEVARGGLGRSAALRRHQREGVA